MYEKLKRVSEHLLKHSCSYAQGMLLIISVLTLISVITYSRAQKQVGEELLSKQVNLLNKQDESIEHSFDVINGLYKVSRDHRFSGGFNDYVKIKKHECSELLVSDINSVLYAYNLQLKEYKDAKNDPEYLIPIKYEISFLLNYVEKHEKTMNQEHFRTLVEHLVTCEMVNKFPLIDEFNERKW